MKERSIKILEFHKIKELVKEYAITAGAKELIEELKPYDNVYEIKEHIQETREALNLLMTKGNPPFEGFYDVRDGVSRALKGGTLNALQLLRIGNMLRSSRKFLDYIKRKEEEEDHKIIEEICEGITPLRKLEESIEIAIVGEDEISDRASSTLSNIRRSLKEKNSSVRERIGGIIRDNSKFLQDNLYSVRGDRYVIPVKSDRKSVV